jgi:hypothetical protein
MAASAGQRDFVDLSKILKRLMARGYRATEESRRTLANDPTTRLFLEAGLQLISDVLGVGESSAPEDQENIPRPFFEWVSLPKVVKRAKQRGPASAAMLRDRWPSRSDFIEDLMAYILWSFHWAGHANIAEEAAARLTGNGDFVEAIKLVAYDDLAVIINDPAQRIALVVTAMAAQDNTARSGRAELYKLIHDNWSALYAATLEARGLKLRPDVDIHDLTNILTALAEGITLRAIADPEANVINHNTKDSLLGKASLMIAAACIDLGDGRPLAALLGGAAEE